MKSLALILLMFVSACQPSSVSQESYVAQQLREIKEARSKLPPEEQKLDDGLLSDLRRYETALADSVPEAVAIREFRLALKDKLGRIAVRITAAGMEADLPKKLAELGDEEFAYTFPRQHGCYVYPRHLRILMAEPLISYIQALSQTHTTQ